MTSDGGATVPGGQKGYNWSFNIHSEGLVERGWLVFEDTYPTLGKVMSTLALHTLL